MPLERSRFELVIDAENLVSELDDTEIRIVDLSRRSVYQQVHLPHALHLQPSSLLESKGEVVGLLPSAQKLEQLIRYLNISDQHHIIAYDDEGGAWASRLLWTLHCIGFQRTSLLNGGIHAWLAAGLPTARKNTTLNPIANLIDVDLSNATDYRITFDELRQRVDQADIQIWDCRTLDEYTGVRLAARRGGHIPAAIHFEWSTAINRQNHLKLHSLEHIRQQLEQLGFRLNENVVVYCQSHHRSAFAYMLGRLLNWPIRAYDGAWSEWGNCLDSPIITGENPF